MIFPLDKLMKLMIFPCRSSQFMIFFFCNWWMKFVISFHERLTQFMIFFVLWMIGEFCYIFSVKICNSFSVKNWQNLQIFPDIHWQNSQFFFPATDDWNSLFFFLRPMTEIHNSFPWASEVICHFFFMSESWNSFFSANNWWNLQIFSPSDWQNLRLFFHKR